MLPGLAVSLICLAIVFYFVDIHKLVEALRLADYRRVVLAVVVTLIWLSVRGIVWRTLLQERASFQQIFLTLNEGYLLNNVLPFRLGEFGRAYLLGRKANLSFFQVLSSIVIERSMDVALAVGIVLSTLPFVVGAHWAGEAALAAGGIILLVFIALFLMARNRQKMIILFEKLSQRWPWLLKLGGKALPAFFDGLEVLTNGKRFITAASWMVCNWLVAIVQYYCYVSAFFPQAKLLWGAFGLGVVALGVAAPSSPGSMGVLELALVGGLSLFGLEPSTALGCAITIHFFQYLTTGLLGVYALSMDGETLGSLYHNVRNLRSELKIKEKS
jgi:uncharacterized protein (TIRG00374 family)